MPSGRSSSTGCRTAAPGERPPSPTPRSHLLLGPLAALGYCQPATITVNWWTYKAKVRVAARGATGHDLEGPRSAMGLQAVAIERCSDLAEPLCAELAPVWELVASIPAPCCDHRQHEDPALA